ncbi:inactive peptidyl-prolyl cis-trans isomerase FKBP6 [Trichogramma pretiosum]|uniref:inactive peptidyl-prolyl cis-trans isomerase FKBP6 n=1 Tax=Trichogramma pretiosum TaxID=7493 RepID=UPI0006C9A22F|nr:inactive peptidyl-prolyl cis-trans isomerase FKBP6 [Trichogramma pretiosum]
MTKVFKATDGFTIKDILADDGFTLDTSEFTDFLEETEELDHAKSVSLSNEEMMRYLENLEHDNDDKINPENGSIPFVGVPFDTLKSKMTSIYENGKILKIIKRDGVGDVVPPDAQVTVEYVGYFEYSDQPFDSTLFHPSKRMVIRLGKGAVIPGLEIGISSMKKFEKSLFIIQSELAYGELGCMPRIPPNAEVLFKVELVDFIDNGAADTYDELTNEERKKFASIEKIVKDLLTTANDNVKRNKTTQAVREYNRVVQYLDGTRLFNDEEEKSMTKYLTRALTNLMVCYNKLSKPKLACHCFNRIPVHHEKHSAKALYQHAKALSMMGECDQAMKLLQDANKLNPGSAEIKKLIHEVEGKRNNYNEFYKKFAKNSLKKSLGTSEESNPMEELAKELCDDFIADEEAVRCQIPEGLSPTELAVIRRIAANKNLTVTHQMRYDEETWYLCKKGYHVKK